MASAPVDLRRKRVQGPAPPSSSTDIGTWLQSLGLGRYLGSFAWHGVDADTVQHLTNEDLAAMGISDPDHRFVLLGSIHQSADNGSLNSKPPKTPARPGTSSIAPSGTAETEEEGAEELDPKRRVAKIKELVRELGAAKLVLDETCATNTQLENAIEEQKTKAQSSVAGSGSSAAASAHIGCQTTVSARFGSDSAEKRLKKELEQGRLAVEKHSRSLERQLLQAQAFEAERRASAARSVQASVQVVNEVKREVKARGHIVRQYEAHIKRLEECVERDRMEREGAERETQHIDATISSLEEQLGQLAKEIAVAEDEVTLKRGAASAAMHTGESGSSDRSHGVMSPARIDQLPADDDDDKDSDDVP
mmetsp:Transcript_48591/g.105387  ORF Transcript_48591/g.105387 Transcript_48591/m.105387 type:complete len:364 (+) Transcript_48591:17-1108(+)